MPALNSPALASSTIASSTIDPTSRQPSHLPSKLNHRLDKRLLTYMAAAGAAGVSVLAMTQPADAKVIYTPADQSLTTNEGRFDLNHDGITDFFFVQYGLGNIWSYLVFPAHFNKMMNHAKPLAPGVSVGPGGDFGGGAQEMANFCVCSGSFASTGSWAGEQNEYMGFEFNIKGAAHFGWARISAVNFGLTLSGYAYETVSLKPIVTGDTGSNNDEDDSVDQQKPAAVSPQASGLGKLALGATGKTAR
jgi:hypothetical protein